MTSPAEIVRRALGQPGTARIQLDRIDCRESLLKFVHQAWSILEPSRKFLSGWAVEAVAEHLEAVTRGEVRRLLVNIPPGCTKSMLVNVFWPAWEWGPKGLSQNRFISASYERGLATRDLVRCRDLVCSEWFQARWPIALKEDQDEKTYYANTQTGWRFASSVGGRLMGYRGDRLIIDDPHDVKAAESDADRASARRWFTEALPSRLNIQEESAMVMIMQRVHAADLSDIAIEQGWTHLCLPMEFEPRNRSYSVVPNHRQEPVRVRRVRTKDDPVPHYVPDPGGALMWPWDPRQEEGELLWPELWPRDAVDRLKVAFRSGDGGSYAEAGQLQQRPVHREGGMFARADFQVVDRIPDGGIWVRGWDLAATKEAGSWTVGVKMGLVHDRVYISDVVRMRGESYEVEEAILATTRADGPGVAVSLPQDPGQAGKAQRNSYAQLLHGFDVHFSPESGDKRDRARPLAAQVGGHNVSVLRAHWLDDFLAEAGLFPGSRYKDQVDAASRAYAWLVANLDSGVALAPATVY